MKTLTENYLSLAAYHYRAAARAAANGDIERAARAAHTARAYDKFAMEESAA